MTFTLKRVQIQILSLNFYFDKRFLFYFWKIYFIHRILSAISPKTLIENDSGISPKTLIENDSGINFIIKKFNVTPKIRRDFWMSLISGYYFPPQLRLGSSIETPEIGELVLSQLCSAVAQVINDGLKPYESGLHVFGRVHITVWRVAEASAEPGELEVFIFFYYFCVLWRKKKIHLKWYFDLCMNSGYLGNFQHKVFNAS